jgi:hypothetical protein
MISPTNQSKNNVNPTGVTKYGIYFWGDPAYTWGDALATWGGILLTPINQAKTLLSALFELQDGSNFLLQDGGTLELQGGSGALVYINSSKS